MKRLNTMKEGDVLFLAGSIPASMPDDIYSRIMKELKDKGVMIVVDATRDLLMNVLEYRPFLIKPNNHELGEIFEVTLKTREDAFLMEESFRKKEPENVLISMAGEGAVLIAENGEVYSSPARKEHWSMV